MFLSHQTQTIRQKLRFFAHFTIIAAAILAFGAHAATPAHAQDIIVGDRTARSLITGKIASFAVESFMLDTVNEQSVNVNIEGLNLNSRHLKRFFLIGDSVEVIGVFSDEGILHAKKLAKIKGNVFGKYREYN